MFQALMKDYITCFRHSWGITLHVSGTHGGLHLDLNIEQYEYMEGPNDGAGIKLMLHEPHDIPLMRDHGLAVPTGMHGFVATQVVQVVRLV